MASPILVQTTFRGRNDNGSETTATWKGTGTNGEDWSQDVDTTFRWRVVITETNARNANNQYLVYYQKNTGGYTLVGTATADVKLVTSTNVTDATATTNQIGTGSFVAGEIDDNGAVTAHLLNNSFTEMEYVLQIVGADVNNGDTINLRAYISGGTALNTYTDTPAITAVKAAPPTEETADADKFLATTLTNNIVGESPLQVTKYLGVGAVFDPATFELNLNTTIYKGVSAEGGKVVEERLYDLY